MKEKIEQLKEKLIECGILEAQESNTAYEQAEKDLASLKQAMSEIVK